MKWLFIFRKLYLWDIFKDCICGHKQTHDIYKGEVATMQDSPKFTSGDYPVASQKYGQKGEKMLTDYPSGREIDSHMLKEQVHILGEICKTSHLFGLLIPLLLVINIRCSINTTPRTAPCPVIKVIDACAKRNLGHFINHNFQPNCHPEAFQSSCIRLFFLERKLSKENLVMASF
ncbi:unnamed protein product [Lactuca saligna]|uniref:Uncharacterized protein n=1 Tax=Lactuca saligna TaxID=75948 RepID=A0AA35ZQA3_LACSI|nr:unnamed protein product [Lactuca saligna]